MESGLRNSGPGRGLCLGHFLALWPGEAKALLFEQQGIERESWGKLMFSKIKKKMIFMLVPQKIK